jgi:2-oxoglutarate ferredoxin oxidoreductase subunit alpha
MAMTAKRRRKLQVLAATLPLPEVHGPAEGHILLVGWGSTRGPICEAVDHSRAQGHSVSGLHLRHLFPLPDRLDEVFENFSHVVVVEMNDEGLYGYGQLAGLLRMRYCDARLRGLNKTDGLTFKVKEILERVKQDVAAGMRHL